MTMKPSAAIFTECAVRLASTPNCDLDQLAHCRAPLIVLAHHRRPASNNITTDAVGCLPVSRFHNAHQRTATGRRNDGRRHQHQAPTAGIHASALVMASPSNVEP